ncbi:membrane protein insertase YidC [Chlamydiifrater phoenicopteri]|uniref:membrane protein insertase YidC n=1 Tax=Chlamydiifrater phoenicopteri TaxID=2681469 RepID=UPI001BD0E0F7|nr:membrane protein insertase YidC [Chlamydiifrater phoenicopteri]
MNKRFFLFVGLVGASFIGCQLFFGYKEFNGYKQIAEKQREMTSSVLSQIESSGLKVVSWKKDSGAEKSAEQQGVVLGNAMLTLSKDPVVSHSLSCGGKDWGYLGRSYAFHGVSVLLYENNASKNSVVDMGKVFLPSVDSEIPVLVVEFRNGKDPLVFPGQYKKGKIFSKDFPILGTSLVFWRSGPDYLPLGVYDTIEERLVALNLPMTRAVVLNDKASYSGSDNHYVLQNEFLQLVVSEKSGSIEGINLPIVSDANKFSIVNEIETDRALAEANPEEATFPGFSSIGADRKKVQEQIGGYYPLLRRGSLDNSEKLLPARYQSFNLVSGENFDHPITSFFRLVDFTNTQLILESTDGRVRKEFSLPKDPINEPYCFNVDLNVRYGEDKVWVTSGIPEVEIMSGAFVPALKYRTIKKGQGSLEKVKLPKAKASSSTATGAHPEWVLNSNGYFGIIITPLDSSPKSFATLYVPGSTAITKLSLIDKKNNQYPESKYPGYEILLPINSDGKSSSFRVYAGPLAEPTLSKIDKTFKTDSGETPDYSSCLVFKGVFGFISEPFARLLFLVMKFFKFLTGSWGISIILLTVFLKIVLYPLNAWSLRSMRRMQKLSPYIQEIQKKYKHEPKRAQLEIMTLYKENKVNPLMGCFPMLIQLPFLIAMFDLLKSSFLLRGASFIPGWIDNLTAPDVIFSWRTPIFLIGNQIHLLPIILGVVMFAQQKLSTTSKTGELTEQQRQQQAMGTMMALLFTVMFYNFPSGLNLYWLSSTILGIAQQWATNKLLDKRNAKNEIVLNKKRGHFR